MRMHLLVHHGRHPGRRASWVAVGAVLVGLLLLAGCGASASPSTTASSTASLPTATLSPTATPVPCTSWRLVLSPNATQYQTNVLLAVSARSSTEAWVVGGNYAESGPGTSLVEHWDGAAWQIIPNPGTDFLNGVAVVTATDVWAVGAFRTYGYGNHPYQPLIVHWNGTQWTSVPSPNAASHAAELEGVAAIAANDVWAVGQIYNASNTALPLTERWDGTTWQIVANPLLPGVTESTLSSVARIPGTNQLWAVGYALKGPRPAYERPLIERWDGTAWHLVAGPALPRGALEGTLRGVVALSPKDAWAVGNYAASNHTIRPLIAHWDGTTWQVVSSPDAGGSLASVAATRASDVRAVGHSFAGDGNTRAALIEHWDGTAWHLVTSPVPSGAGDSVLSGVTTDSAGAFWAVGSYRTAAHAYQTLIAHCP